jgi:hypothetical protein
MSTTGGVWKSATSRLPDFATSSQTASSFPLPACHRRTSHQKCSSRSITVRKVNPRYTRRLQGSSFGGLARWLAMQGRALGTRHPCTDTQYACSVDHPPPAHLCVDTPAALVYLAFRTLFWNSEAILPEFLKRGEAELATDAFIPHNHSFLYALPLNHNFLQLGRPIAAPLG